MKDTLKPKFYSPLRSSSLSTESLNTTLGKDSYHWSFSKANRFTHKQITSTPDFIIPPTSLSKRSTSFGFGKRWEPKNDKGRDSPPPTCYSPPSYFAVHSRAVNFSSGVTAERTPIKTKIVPGPGAYNVDLPFGKNSPKFTLRPRIQFKEKYLTPAPGTYNPSFKIVERSNFSKIGFGHGERKNMRQLDESPGPGTYDLPGIFNRSNSGIFAPIRNQTSFAKKTEDYSF
ncbi:unnamed protein product [Blepharisma stoltei]|uniref:Uncharacterized protein n=1 Tax=Blepharisma stoltei TaxID=1481888 RepID=A0AAU9KAR3_9CILI|nr:unnamed protein product [Blepharisma stoltei]